MPNEARPRGRGYHVVQAQKHERGPHAELPTYLSKRGNLRKPRTNDIGLRPSERRRLATIDEQVWEETQW